MRSSWLKLALVLLIGVSLVGAPCRDCQPKQDRAHCGHPCCPKPKPARTCAWQPSDLASLDTSQHITVEAPLPAVLTASVAVPAAAVESLWSDERPDASPPPLYLIHATLLI